MTLGGTARYAGQTDLPPLVQRAVALAEATAFDLSCAPEHGRLLHLLARGRSGGRIGETGTGCGVGLAWMVSACDTNTELVSVEIDGDRAAAAAGLFAELPNVTVLHADWTGIVGRGPFDLLVLDGAGGGKAGEVPVEPAEVLVPGGMLVLDDFTPLAGWPPTGSGSQADAARQRWLEHPDLLATEIRVTPDLASLVAVRRP